jgi:hypothetical protein
MIMHKLMDSNSRIVMADFSWKYNTLTTSPHGNSGCRLWARRKLQWRSVDELALRIGPKQHVLVAWNVRPSATGGTILSFLHGLPYSSAFAPVGLSV